MPKGDGVLAWRDRAIIDFFLYTGSRIGTGSKLKVTDFHDQEGDPTIRRERCTKPAWTWIAGADSSQGLANARRLGRAAS